MSAKTLLQALDAGPDFGKANISGGSFCYPNNIKTTIAPFVMFLPQTALGDSSKTYGSITLYLPPTVKVNYTADYEEMSLPVTRDINIAEGAMDALVGAVSGRTSGADAGAWGGALANQLGSSLPAGWGNALKEAGYYGKAIINPHMALLFKGMRFREFAFSFQLMARNKKEAEEIQKIIWKFKYHEHPAMQGSGALLGFPEEFDIFVATRPEPNSPWEDENSEGDNQGGSYYMFRFRRCVLHRVDVDYAGSGVPSFFVNGAPVDIRLDLVFKETVLLTKDDIKKRY
jgi:hypothetical protein